MWKFIKWVPNLHNSAANYNISLTNGRPYLYWMGKCVTLICPWVYHRVNMYFIWLENVFDYPTPRGKYFRLTMSLLSKYIVKVYPYPRESNCFEEGNQSVYAKIIV